MPRPRVIFLDNAHELQGLRTSLAGESCWEMEFCHDEAAATGAMERSGAGIVVAGPGRPDWLQSVRKRWPRAARIALSGPQEMKAIIRGLATAHQYLRAPCDPALLRGVLEQAFMLLELVDDPDMVDAVGGLDGLPTLPKAYGRLVEAMNDPNLGVRDIAEIAILDPILSTGLLEMVNSSYYAFEIPVRSVRQAVGILGPELTAGMALSSAITRSLKGDLHELRKPTASCRP